MDRLDLMVSLDLGEDAIMSGIDELLGILKYGVSLLQVVLLITKILLKPIMICYI